MGSAVEQLRGTETEPEPLLVRFLGKHRLQLAEIVGEEIEVTGIDWQRDELPLAKRFVTPDEIDQTKHWLNANPQGSLKDTPLVNYNMKMLQSLRTKMPLPPRALP